ncbi:MAG: hypothetical protein VW989_07210 [Rhodobiaceae bacterium]
MATVRQSIMALYEQSQKSAAEGQAMFAVIESEAVTPDEVDFGISTNDGRPPIARRFDELRNLADREMPDWTSHHDAAAPSANMTSTANDPAVTGSDGNWGVHFDAGKALPPIDTPRLIETPRSPDTPTSSDSDDNAGDISADSQAPASMPALPNEPPAPASSDAVADLDVADIQKLVRQAWEDETALDNIDSLPTPGNDASVIDAPGNDNSGNNNSGNNGTGHVDGNDDPDMETAMQEIAAAVVKSGDAPEPVDLAAVKAELVAAMRSELQAVVAADLRPIIKAAIAEALQELPAAQPKTRAKKAAAGGTAKKKAARKKATTRAKTAAATKQSGD